MGKKKRKTTTPTTSATAAGSDLLNIDDINLRTAGPVITPIPTPPAVRLCGSKFSTE